MVKPAGAPIGRPVGVRPGGGVPDLASHGAGRDGVAGLALDQGGAPGLEDLRRAADGAVDVPPTAWIRLDFAGLLTRPWETRFELLCEGDAQLRLVDVLTIGPDRLGISPKESALPHDRSCRLGWCRCGLRRFATSSE